MFSHAFTHLRHATLLRFLMHFHTYVMGWGMNASSRKSHVASCKKSRFPLSVHVVFTGFWAKNDKFESTFSDSFLFFQEVPSTQQSFSMCIYSVFSKSSFLMCENACAVLDPTGCIYIYIYIYTYVFDFNEGSYHLLTVIVTRLGLLIYLWLWPWCWLWHEHHVQYVCIFLYM